MPQDLDVFLLHGRQGQETGPRIAEELGIPHSSEDPDRRVDYLIRWGTSQRVHYVPSEETLNLRRAIRANSNKLDALRVMRKSGINVPDFSSTPGDLEFPIIGRNESHMQGRDVTLYMQRQDIEEFGPSDYYVKYISKQTEYRVHVFKGKVLKAHQKVRVREEDESYDEEQDYDPVVWNYETGWRFRNVREQHPAIFTAMSAVSVMELDFGAVDLLVGEDGRGYVLEVNTCPGLDEPNIERYCRAFSDAIGLGYDPSDEVQEDDAMDDAAGSSMGDAPEVIW